MVIEKPRCQLPMALLAIIIIGCFIWVPHIFRPYWIDETITAWIARAPFNLMLERSINFQNHWSLYFVLTWLFERVTSGAEWVSRIINFPIIILGAFLLYLTVRKRFTPRIALASVIFYCSSEYVSDAAVNYRPYPIILLAFVTSLYLLSFPESNRRVLAAGLAFGTAVALNLVYIFSSALLLAFHFAALRRCTFRRKAAISTLFMIGMLVPLAASAPNLSAIFSRRSVLTIHPTGSFMEYFAILDSIFGALMPHVVLMSILVSFIICLGSGGSLRRVLERTPATDQFIVLAVILCLIPPGLKYLIDCGLGLRVNIARYWYWVAIPQSVFMGVLVSRIITSRQLFLLLPAIIFFNDFKSTRMDYPLIVREINALTDATPECALIVQSQLIESNAASYYENEESLSYLTTPFVIYPLTQRYRPAPIAREPFDLPRASCYVLMTYRQSVGYLTNQPSLFNLSTSHYLTSGIGGCSLRLFDDPLEVWRCPA